LKRLLTALILTLALAVTARGGELEEIVNLALKSSPKLQAVRRELNISGYQVKEALSEYLPRVELSYTYTDLSKVPGYKVELPGAPLEGSFSFFKRKFFQKELSLSYPLFTGGKRRALVSLRKAQRDSSYFRFQEELNRLVAQVKEDYYEVLKAKGLVKAARDSLKAAKEHYRQVESFYQEGIATRRELLEGAVKLSQAEEELQKAQGYLRVTLEKLRADSGAEIKEVRGELPEKLPHLKYSLNQLVELARKERPLLKELSLIEKSAREGIRLVKGSFLPQVQVELSYSQTSRYPLNGNFSSKSASVGIYLPLFEGGKRFWQLKRAREELLKVRANLMDAERAVKLQVVKSYTELETARKRVKTSRKRLEEAKELLKDSRERYRERVGTSTEVVDAIAYLSQAESSYYTAVADYLKAFSQLEYATGVRLR